MSEWTSKRTHSLKNATEWREYIGAARNSPLCSTPDQLPWLLQAQRGLVPKAGRVGQSKGPRRHPWKTGALFLPLPPPDGQARTQPWAPSTGPLESIISGTEVSSWLVGTHVKGAPPQSRTLSLWQSCWHTRAQGTNYSTTACRHVTITVQ